MEKEDTRVVMKFHPALAPFKAAVLPLAKKLAPVAEPILRSFLSTSTWTMTQRVPSGRDTEEKMKSVRLSVSALILILKQMVVLQFVIEIPWSK